MARAATVEEKRTCLGSEATVILNFYKNLYLEWVLPKKVTGYFVTLYDSKILCFISINFLRFFRNLYNIITSTGV